MRRVQTDKSNNTEYLVNLLGAMDLVEEKVRINLYLPRALVKVMDTISDNRSELVKELVVAKVKNAGKLPYGILKSKTSEKEMKSLSAMWDAAVNEL